MFTLFSQERVDEIHDYNLTMEARAEGKAEGKAEGRAESRLEIAKKLLSIPLPYDQIAMATGLSLTEIEQLAV